VNPPRKTQTVATMTALEQAAIAFDGGYSAEEIKARLDEVLRLYNVPITEENYLRAGSALVTLRKTNGVSEMRILDHMIRSHVAGVTLTFPQGAAISATAILAGDR
jgi:hypothetical protein